MLATGSDDGTILVWDCRKLQPQPLKRLVGHIGWVKNAEPIDDRHLLSASFDGTVRLWDVLADDGIPSVSRALPRRCFVFVCCITLRAAWRNPRHRGRPAFFVVALSDACIPLFPSP
jgi:WD40 repeat protein